MELAHELEGKGTCVHFLQLLGEDGVLALGYLEASMPYCSHVIARISVYPGRNLLHRNPLCLDNWENKKVTISIIVNKIAYRVLYSLQSSDTGIKCHLC